MSAVTVVRTLLEPGAPGAIRVGRPAEAGPLTLVPLFHDRPANDYLLFSAAHDAGVVSVAEVGEAGSVPELLVRNEAAVPVLLVEGEMLVGLKQNRVLNVSVLVPARARTRIPVACVEAGRWRHATSTAAPDDFLLSPMVRARKNASVAASARRSGRYDADQSAVWDGVAERLRAHGVESATSAYSDVGGRLRSEIARLVAGAAPLPGQAGVAALVGGEALCLDLFDREATLRALWDGLVGSYAADALGSAATRRPDPEASAAAVRDWLKTLAAGTATAHPGAGAGEIVAVTSGGTGANALVANGAVVHLSAFGGPGDAGRGPELAAPRPGRSWFHSQG